MGKFKADVTDLAGNPANDGMPTVIYPDGARVCLRRSSAFLGEQNATVDLNIQFGEFTFHSDQSAFASLTSQGLALTVVISPDGQNIDGHSHGWSAGVDG
ncbi:hypothetical protein [Vibrio vulnificus]|uniref:hypothetical protein n=1 Tax=Vibrio vulnificus TaxID=672 RepID=UPI001EECAA53|nr:hypothetical protein [Vibrio vulnificus]MCG6288875.1 hypothetical protein [Vibrio vulnificus]